MANYKKEVALWYEAFNNKDPDLFDRIPRVLPAQYHPQIF